MSQQPFASIQTYFANLEDKRDPDLIDHLLIEMVITTICAVICGAENWVDVANWGEEKQQWLRQYLPLENGVASHDTFRRVFLLIEPEQFQACFQQWIQAVFNVTEGQVIAIDGKQLRGSRDVQSGKAAICMVSAWATANEVVLGQRKCEEKSNEIKAIPELLKQLELKGCIVTIDAAGCQKNNATILVKGGAEYILALKENQETMYDDVKFMFDRAHRQEFVGIDSDYHRQVTKGHDRIEIRECWAIDDEACLAFLRQRKRWRKLTSIVMIRSYRKQGQEENQKVTTKESYYISSLPCDAVRILNAKRAHWKIENQLHWVLDVAFDEDHHQLSGNGAANLAVIRHMALSLLKQEKTAKGGIKAKRLKAAWSTDYLERVLTI